MTKVTLHGRKVYGGIGEGEALVTNDAVAFCAGIDPLTGEISERTHELRGKSLAGKVLVFPFGKGSSAFSKAAYALFLSGKAPAAWLIGEVNPQTAMASVVMHTPAVTGLDQDPAEVITTGDWVKVDGDTGIVEITKTD